MKTKALIVIDSLGPGGAQRQIVEYLKCADKDNFEIKIVNLDKHYDTFSDEIEKLGYEIISIAHKGFINLTTLYKLIKLFKKRIAYHSIIRIGQDKKMAAEMGMQGRERVEQNFGLETMMKKYEEQYDNYKFNL